MIPSSSDLSDRERTENGDAGTTDTVPAEETATQALPSALPELEVLRAEASEWRDKYLRKLAEFDNFRKRMRQESELVRQFATETLLLALLPVMDDFDRLLASWGESDDPHRKGVELVREKLRAFLEAQDVHRFDSIGKPFNPEEHEALLTQVQPDFPSGTVLAEITPGYRMGERVIRHAQVVVSAEPETPAASAEDEPS